MTFYPKWINETETVFSINGTGFSKDITSVKVVIGGETCAPFAIYDFNIQCSVKLLPVGTQSVIVSVLNKGKAIGDMSLYVQPIIQSISPIAGSVYGGTEISIIGIGFVKESIDVTVGGIICEITDVSLSHVKCLTRHHSATFVDVVDISNQITFPYI